MRYLIVFNLFLVVYHSDEDVKPDLALLESYTYGTDHVYQHEDTVQPCETSKLTIDDKVAAFLSELSPKNCPICHRGIMEKDYQNHIRKHNVI